MRKIILLCPTLLFALTAAASTVGAEEFILRAEYPQVQTISTAELDREYDRAVIVDVRSKIEFDAIHIASARHIPVALGTFLAEVEKERGKQDPAPLVFYCNGHSCAKSYQAAQKAADAGFVKVFCYDAGVDEWIHTYPARGALMGRTPADPKKMLSDQDLVRRSIPWGDFRRRAGEPETIVIDIREPFQHLKDERLPQQQKLPLPEVRNIPSDRLVPLLRAGEFKGKKLLITDAVGKQVQWLQYYLEDNGYTDYFFLRKGVLGAAEAGAFN